jgi:hypothetical protein
MDRFFLVPEDNRVPVLESSIQVIGMDPVTARARESTIPLHRYLHERTPPEAITRQELQRVRIWILHSLSDLYSSQFRVQAAVACCSLVQKQGTLYLGANAMPSNSPRIAKIMRVWAIRHHHTTIPFNETSRVAHLAYDLKIPS